MSRIKWNKKYTDLPEFDYSIKNPRDEERHHEMYLEEMPVRNYLEIQENRNSNLLHKRLYREEYTKHLEQKNPNYKEGIPVPVLEYDEFGKLTGWQEGYRRGLYAEQKGEKTIPVYKAYKKSKYLDNIIKRKNFDVMQD